MRWRCMSLAANLAVILLTACGAAAEVEQVDLGEFAKVVSSDPDRVDGARSDRLQPFRREDVFLTQPVKPGPDGVFVAPGAPGKRRTIGLEWCERRVLERLAIDLVDAAKFPPEAVEVQYWSSAGREDSWGDIGQTPWQGLWQRAPGRLAASGNRLEFIFDASRIPEFQNQSGVFKVRWVFAPGSEPLRIRSLSAWSPSKWTTADFRLEMEPSLAVDRVNLVAYNGYLLTEGRSPKVRMDWNSRSPATIRVRYSVPMRSKADRTLLRFELPSGGFGVAMEDVLASDGVYVKHAGLFVSPAASKLDLAGYRAKIAGRKTILQQVREMPDQTFEQSMAKLWRPAQNEGPTMLSLACDNRKFTIPRAGGLQCDHLAIELSTGAKHVELLRLDFGQLGIDTTVRPGNQPGLPLRLKDRTYAKGIGLHANADLAIQLDGKYRAFEALAGIYPSGAGGGTASLQIEVDGQTRFDSGVLRERDAPRTIQVPLAGAQRMVLRVRDAGDGILNDAVNLANARLIQSPSGEEYLSDLCAPQRQGQEKVARSLEGQWLPIPVTEIQRDGLVYQQRSFVAPSRLSGDPSPIAVVDFTVSNHGQENRPVAARLAVSQPKPDGAMELKRAGNRILVQRKGQLLACIECVALGALKLATESGSCRLEGDLAPSSSARLVVYVPGAPMPVSEHAALAGHKKLRAAVERYWSDQLAQAIRIEIPERLIRNVFLATQMHCLMAAREQEGGKFVEPWIASAAYGPLDSEAQAVILGMDLSGHQGFARRSLQFFLKDYRPEGYLARDYTLMGTGQNLWTLAEHYSRSPDPAWLKRIAPQLVRTCRWIGGELVKTKRLGLDGCPLPEHGLVPPGVLADWNRYAYYFYANAQFWAGLNAAANMLRDVEPEAAKEIARLAVAYREDILRAYRWNQARMPVLPLRDGAWIPATPSSLYCFGLSRDFFGGVSAIGHDVEVGGNHLIPLGLLAPRDHEADWIVAYLEDRWFLIDGIFGEYPAAENEADWFTRGGFAKLQAHYARTSDIHALRDDVKPFVRTYFNTLPILLNRENLTFWEHLNHGGAWNKTHESGWFLEMTRAMLLTERGNELWLAPFVTDNWLKDGMVVGVANAPTRFGKVRYKLTSFVRRGVIEAEIAKPSGPLPERIVLRVRHPEGKPMRSVQVNGQSHPRFDPRRETIDVPVEKVPATVSVRYE